MTTEILGIILMYGLTVAMAIPFGRYIGKIFSGEKTWLDPVLNPVDKIFFKLGGIKPEKEMNWPGWLMFRNSMARCGYRAT